MKNKMMNLLRGGVFLLALAAAFAFTNPVPPNSIPHALENGDWVPIPGLVEGTHYACPGTGVPCTAIFEDNDPTKPMLQVLSEGVFTRL